MVKLAMNPYLDREYFLNRIDSLDDEHPRPRPNSATSLLASPNWGYEVLEPCRETRTYGSEKTGQR